jgi:hypothetical protein
MVLSTTSAKYGIFERAKKVVERCRTNEGFLASADLYKDLWLRDLFYSESSLLKLGYHETVRRHFETFLKYQLKNGQVSTVISKGWKQLLGQRFHKWTCDSEILLVLGIMMYAKTTGDYSFVGENRKKIDRCVEFVRSRLNPFGLVPGADWRDAIVNYYQGRKYLLSNQVLLAQMYDELEMTEDARALKETILELFVSQPSEMGSLLPIVDCISWASDEYEKENEDGEHRLKFEDRLDCLGASLAIINGITSPNLAVEIAKSLDLPRTKHGYRNLTPPIRIRRFGAFVSIDAMNSFVRNGAFLRNRPYHYQNSGVWPFVEARVASALKKVGFSEKVSELSKLMRERDGFNEWYSPIDGQGKGSRDQLWTAAAVLEQFPLA